MGDLDVAHFGPENSQDSCSRRRSPSRARSAIFDLVYAGAYFKRNIHSVADYSDYSEFYDRVYGSGAYWVGNNGKPIMPQEFVLGAGYFEKWSHELRVYHARRTGRCAATIGAFIQRQLHDILADYSMPGYGFTNPFGSGNPNGFADFFPCPDFRTRSGSPTSSASTVTRPCSPRPPGTSPASCR